MNVTPLVGLETEYAIMIENKKNFNHSEACHMLLDKFNSTVSKEKNIHFIPVFSDIADKRDIMLSNGARFYIDMGHPEYSTPECVDPMELIACDKAGELIINYCLAEINKELPNGQHMRILKNNSDHKGHTYGCHENYLLSTPTFERLIIEQKEELFKNLIPFLVTRQIFTGAGKVAYEDGAGRIKFQVSQRADFFKTIIGPHTTDERPIINTRDEPHADRSRFRRLHVITGDANMSEYSTYLKIGVTSLVLRMIEDGVIAKDFSLADPVKAIGEISHDTSLTQKVKLVNGKELTALEIQKAFLETAGNYLSGKNNYAIPPFMENVCRKWDEVLNGLNDNPMGLSKKIDWIIKKYFIERWMKRETLNENDFSDPRIEEIDFNYHDIDREKSIFYLLQKHDLVERLLLSDQRIKSFVTEPPPNSRAFLRGTYIKTHPGEVIAVDWERIVMKNSTIEWSDPTRFSLEKNKGEYHAGTNT